MFKINSYVRLTVLMICVLILAVMAYHSVWGREDNWGEEYTETVEWHEIGGQDPRHCGGTDPGVHAVSLGEPGCLN